MNLPVELKWTIWEKYHFKFDKETINCAIKRGDIFLLKHAIKENVKVITMYNFINAIKWGKIEIVDWFYPEIEADFVSGGIYSAAQTGRLEMVKYLHGKRKDCQECTQWTMDIAAENGHLEIVRWLHENCQGGCSKRAMDWAAAKGHIPMLNWLYTHRREGCTEWAGEFAKKYEQTKTLQWLQERNLY